MCLEDHQQVGQMFKRGCRCVSKATKWGRCWIEGANVSLSPPAGGQVLDRGCT